MKSLYTAKSLSKSRGALEASTKVGSWDANDDAKRQCVRVLVLVLVLVQRIIGAQHRGRLMLMFRCPRVEPIYTLEIKSEESSIIALVFSMTTIRFKVYGCRGSFSPVAFNII
jgi:hypothetical protein